MEAFLVILGIFGALGVASGFVASQIKKGYLLELPEKAGVSDHQVEGMWGRACLTGKWKDRRIQVEALATGPGMPGSVSYRLDARFSFNADIRPGELMLEKMKKPEPKGAQSAASPQESFKPWRAKLTAEEEAEIRRRHGEEPQAAPAAKAEPQLFHITSPTPDEVANFLKDPKKTAALEDLFKEGIGAVCIHLGDVTAIKSPYTSKDDLEVSAVEKRLSKLKILAD
jgi:hypothetical protein